MSTNRLKYSILRLINYKESADAHRFKKSTDYVMNHTKTNDGKWVKGHCLKLDDPLKSLRALEEHWHNESLAGRLFKHGIISFGSPDLKPEDAMAIMEDTLKYYKHFPYLWALHTDVPGRLHAHFILGMRNMVSGKKFTQSKADLLDFRRHYHKVSLGFKLLGLKDFRQKDDNQGRVTTLSNDIYIPRAYDSMPYPELQYSVPQTAYGNTIETQVYSQRPQSQAASMFGRNFASQLFDDIRDDFHSFFEIGLYGGFGHGK